ncbi:Serine/threonine-protein kinase AfsK [Thermoflexales bacterium]|nr:Serine/threonine-protein kinase AfsK [Thermoflexales bacterium]
MSEEKSLKRIVVWTVIIGLLAALPVWQPNLIAVAAQWPLPLAQTGSPSQDLQSSRLLATSLLTTTQAPGAGSKVFLPLIMQPSTEKSWSMAGANPQRTSWTPDEVRGTLHPEWYRVIDAYIPAKVQVVAANNTLFVSTANGLYALNAQTGATSWVYATDLPLGHSPTIANGVAYVGGFDHKLHAVDINTGQKLWTFDGAAAGYDTNPVVVNGLVYLGNRDGYFYAIYAHDHASRGKLAWKFQAGAPIHFSAAYKNGVVYFASDAGYAYALNATTGAQVWKSARLPVTGFHSWWPVIYTNPQTKSDVVVLAGSENYRLVPPGPTSDLENLDGDEVLYPTYGSQGEIGPRDAQGRMDISSAAAYWEQKPYRRSTFVLSTATGQEVTFDINGNGNPDYVPFFWWGTRSGMRYPPVVGGDGLFYLAQTYEVNGHYSLRGQVAGWYMGTKWLKTSSAWTQANDEPMGYSAGGNVVYWNLCCDRTGGAFDVTTGQAWNYYSYDLDHLVGGYNVRTTGIFESNAVQVFGNSQTNSGWNGQAAGRNGVYGYHGDQNPPVPYRGRVYMHRGNSIIAWSPTGGSRQLSSLPIQKRSLQPLAVSATALRDKLASEVQKILAAGHLRPGFGIHGSFGLVYRWEQGDNLTDYFHNSADTLQSLALAYPHLSATLQAQVKTYLQNEYNNYSPCEYTHTGWVGASREWATLPPEVESAMSGMQPTSEEPGYSGWNWPPHTFYALWKYAQVVGNAQTIFNSCRSRLTAPPDQATLLEHPEAHNAWIAGYLGYIQLAKLAGNTTEANNKQATLNSLLSSRAANLAQTINNPWGPDEHHYGQTLSVARNFMFLTPELGDYLADHAGSTATAAIDLYTSVAPYWFVTWFEASYAESIVQPLYDYAALFAAKSMISNATQDELARYLDVPAFARGDLFYIQNLVQVLEAPVQ